MTRVGIRELRQRASELLRRVQAGESFEVTDRGRPVAVLSPVKAMSPYEEMVASGDITRGGGDIRRLPPPLKIPKGHELPSKVLERLRRDER